MIRTAYLLRPVSEDVVAMEHQSLAQLTRDEAWSWLAWQLLTTTTVGGGVAKRVEIMCKAGHHHYQEREEFRCGKTSNVVEGIMWVYRSVEASDEGH